MGKAKGKENDFLPVSSPLRSPLIHAAPLVLAPHPAFSPLWEGEFEPKFELRVASELSFFALIRSPFASLLR